MSEVYFAVFVALGLIIVGLLLLVYKRIKKLADSSEDHLDVVWMNRFDGLEKKVSEGFSESRKELREVSSENRQETQASFKGLQDSLLNQLTENLNLQKNELTRFSDSLQKLSEKLQDDAKENRTELQASLKSFEDSFDTNLKGFSELLRNHFSDLNKQQNEANEQARKAIVEIRETIEKQLEAIRSDNEKQLGEMRQTVDEKLHSTLEKRLGESFKIVSERLEVVHKGLGEMQQLAVGVGDLKKVLSNVKTRGILGEYQLGNILEQILTPDQYSTNVATKKGSQANVEYAVRLPGKLSDEEVWLPIDSKFPMESYQLLLDAYELGEVGKIEQAQVDLLKRIEGFAKDISGKYIDPPHTTDFAIMFLPVESLYGEVLRHPGFFELLQRKYHITITGPTTLSALLNSLQMGFRTLVVQKRSSEVWKVLSEVKTEFGKFSEQLDKVHKHLNTASTSLETLRNTRSSVMDRKLRQVESLDVSDVNPSITKSD